VVSAFTLLVLILGVGQVTSNTNSPSATSISVPTPSSLVVTAPPPMSATTTASSKTKESTTASATASATTSGMKSSGTRFSNGGVVGVVVGVLSIAFAVCISA
jgi:hypothetical protein